MQWNVSPGAKGLQNLVGRVPSWVSVSDSEKCEVRLRPVNIAGNVHHCETDVLPLLTCDACGRDAHTLRTFFTFGKLSSRCAVVQQDTARDVAILRLRSLRDGQGATGAHGRTK